MFISVWIAILSVVVAMWAWRHVLVSRTVREDPTLRADAAAALPEPAPSLSVLIPARNESANIRGVLETLLAQDYPDIEVIVADDSSEDDTADIVREVAEDDSRVRLVSLGELPSGWTGKTHALWQIARQARGEILLFLDADVTLDPGALAVMTSYLVENRLDMLSMLLRVESSSVWENAVCLLTGTMLVGRFPLNEVNDPDSPLAFANGQAIMMRAEVYRAVGGHERVKSFLLEDIALAELVKHGGHRLAVAYGFDLAAARMYPRLGDFFRGWARIFNGAFVRSPKTLLLVLGLLIVFTLHPYVALIVSGICLLAGAADLGAFLLLWVSLAAVVVMTSLTARLNRMTRSRTRLHVVLHLPAALIATGIVLSAIAKRYSSRGIVWKGTQYDSRPEAQSPA